METKTMPLLTSFFQEDLKVVFLCNQTGEGEEIELHFRCNEPEDLGVLYVGKSFSSEKFKATYPYDTSMSISNEGMDLYESQVEVIEIQKCNSHETIEVSVKDCSKHQTFESSSEDEITIASTSSNSSNKHSYWYQDEASVSGWSFVHDANTRLSFVTLQSVAKRSFDDVVIEQSQLPSYLKSRLNSLSQERHVNEEPRIQPAELSQDTSSSFIREENLKHMTRFEKLYEQGKRQNRSELKRYQEQKSSRKYKGKQSTKSEPKVVTEETIAYNKKMRKLLKKNREIALKRKKAIAQARANREEAFCDLSRSMAPRLVPRICTE